MSNTYLDKEGLTHFVDALNKKKIGNVSNDEGGGTSLGNALTLSKTLSGATGTVRIEPEALTGSLSFMQTDSTGNKTQWWMMSGGGDTNYVASRAELPIQIYNPYYQPDVTRLQNELNAFKLNRDFGLLMFRGLGPSSKHFLPLKLNGNDLYLDDYVVVNMDGNGLTIIRNSEPMWLLTNTTFSFEIVSTSGSSDFSTYKTMSYMVILIKNRPFLYSA